MTDPRHIVVMLGGPSAERDVSLRSGAAVARALRARGHRVTELDPATPGWQLPAGTDAVMLVLHGTYGEDGTVQRELDALGVPYTGCDAAASELAFDKVRTKERCLAAGVPTPAFFVRTTPAPDWPGGWQPPVVVKPVRQGSSVGLGFVDRPEDLGPALARALAHDTAALVEARIPGIETTVGVLDGVPLPVVEVQPKAGGYDYENKYTAGRTEYHCPARLSPEATRAVQEAARAACQAVGVRDYARVDVMVTPAGHPWVLEVNTLPGMTELSLFPKAAAAAGLGFEALCERLVELALRRTPKPQPEAPA